MRTPVTPRSPTAGAKPARLRWCGAVLSMGLLMSMMTAGCGGGSGASADGTASPAPTAAPEFDVFSGDAACGAGGCSGDNGDGSGVGTGADGGDGAGGGLGAMRNVRVTVTKPDGTALGSALLVNNLVSLYPRRYAGPVVLEFADDGSGNGSYFDEALGTWVPLADHSLHVMVPVLSHHVSANVLTEVAYQWAQAHRAGAGLETVMAEANATVRDAFNQRLPAGWAIDDITDYAPAVSDTTTAGALPNTHAGRYAVVMAAQSLLARAFDSTLAAPALALIGQLGGDIADDGSLDASSAPLVAYDATLPQALGVALATAKSRWGVTAMPTVPPNILSLCVNPALYRPGAGWVLNYQVTDAAGAKTTETDTMTVTGLKPFQSIASALEIVRTVTTPDGMVTTASYIDPDISTGIVSYGSLATSAGGTELTVFATPSTDATILLDPPNDYSAVGVFGSSTVTQYDAAGTLVSGPTTTSFVYESALASVPESVATAGGLRANSCHYDLLDRLSGNLNKLRDDWVTTSGQGVVIKSIEYDASGAATRTRLLVDGFVNGQAVR